MANFQATYYSLPIGRQTTFMAAIPNDVPPMMMEGNPCYKRPMKTLYLLHGFSGHFGDWMYGSLMSNLAMKYNLAIIAPNGDNSFYLNWGGTGFDYETFVGEDLVQYTRSVFGLSDKKEDTYIGGLSMGGFGAIHTALAYPDTFGKMFGLSSALIIHDIMGMKEGAANEVADYDYYHKVFGDLDQLETSHANPEYLVKERLEKGDTIQPIYMACGTEDFLLEQNRAFRDFLKESGVELTYHESKGIHDWDFWNEYLEKAIQWMLSEK